MYILCIALLLYVYSMHCIVITFSEQSGEGIKLHCIEWTAVGGEG